MLKDILPMLTAPRRSSTSKIIPAGSLQSISGEDEFTNSEVKKKPSKSSLPILSTRSGSAKTAPYVLPGSSFPTLASPTLSCPPWSALSELSPVDLDPVIAEQINRAIKLVDRNGTGVVSYTGLSSLLSALCLSLPLSPLSSLIGDIRFLVGTH
jgi:hypothetical protein